MKNKKFLNILKDHLISFSHQKMIYKNKFQHDFHHFPIFSIHSPQITILSQSQLDIIPVNLTNSLGGKEEKIENHFYLHTRVRSVSNCSNVGSYKNCVRTNYSRALFICIYH